MSKRRVNVTSKSYTGTKVWAENRNRQAFFVICTAGSATIELGDGGGLIPLPLNSWFEPAFVPTSKIEIIVGAGTVVVVSDQGGV